MITGRRSEGAWLSDDADACLSAWLAMAPDLQAPIARLVGDLSRQHQEQDSIRE